MAPILFTYAYPGDPIEPAVLYTGAEFVHIERGNCPALIIINPEDAA